MSYKQIDEWVRRQVVQLGQILVFDLRAIVWPALAIPFVVATLTILALCYGIFPISQAWVDFWDFTAGIWVTGAALGVAVVRLAISRRPYWLWLSVMASMLFCRELHFAGSNIMVHIVIGLLFLLAWLAYDKMADYFTTRFVVTMIVMLFTAYTITQTLDQRWWKFLPREDEWKKAAEEFLEVAGHLILLTLTLLSRKRKSKPTAKPPVPMFLQTEKQA